MDLEKYITELKRRNVIKSGVAYLIIAWLIAQVASIVFPTFGAPPYFMKVLLIVLSIGFPVNILFSWYYDITSKGIKKTKNIDGELSKSIFTSKLLNKVIIVSLSIAVVGLLYNQFNSNSKKTEIDQDFTNESFTSNNLIAVLPFLNTKSDENSDYLGFAIADQIIGSLVYLNGITVRPSSSIRKYENKTIDPVEVGKELNVDYILVGNYLNENDIIRLNIELININTNKIVWREPIEVNFQSAFELQDIVSKKVVKGLNVQFSKKEINRINKNIPASSLAYEYYLRAIAYPISNDGDELAIEMIKKSIELDSMFAPSYALYGDRLHRLTNYGLLNQEESLKAVNFLKKGLLINPDLFESMFNLAMIYTETDRIQEAVDMTKKMIVISPNNGEIHFLLAYIYRYAGMNEDAVFETEKALLLDAKNPNFRSSMMTYAYAGKFEQALSVSANFKESPFTIYQYGYILFQMDRKKESAEYLERSIKLDSEGMTGIFSRSMLAIMEGNKDETRSLMEKLESYDLKDSEVWYYISQIYGIINDRPACFRSLRRTIEGGFFNYPMMTRDIFFDPVRDDEEFKKILEIAKTKHLTFKEDLNSNKQAM